MLGSGLNRKWPSTNEFWNDAASSEILGHPPVRRSGHDAREGEDGLDQATGRVRPGDVSLLDEYFFLVQKPAAATAAVIQTKAKESWSVPTSIQVVVISLTGNTPMVMVSAGASVLTLHDTVADVL